MKSLHLLTLFSLTIHPVYSFIWPVRSAITPDSPVLVTEGHLFGTNAGPLFMSQGSSYVETDLTMVA